MAVTIAYFLLYHCFHMKLVDYKSYRDVMMSKYISKFQKVFSEVPQGIV